MLLNMANILELLAILGIAVLQLAGEFLYVVTIY